MISNPNIFSVWQKKNFNRPCCFQYIQRGVYIFKCTVYHLSTFALVLKANFEHHPGNRLLLPSEHYCLRFASRKARCNMNNIISWCLALGLRVKIYILTSHLQPFLLHKRLPGEIPDEVQLIPKSHFWLIMTDEDDEDDDSSLPACMFCSICMQEVFFLWNAQMLNIIATPLCKLTGWLIFPNMIEVCLTNKSALLWKQAADGIHWDFISLKRGNVLKGQLGKTFWWLLCCY